MSIDSLRDGFVTLCLNTSLNAYSGATKMLVEGQYIAPGSNGAAADTPILVNSVNAIDGLFTPGSIIAEALRKAFAMAGPYVDIYALPRADASGGVAAVYTMTITGPATSTGVFSLFWLDGVYNIQFPVTVAETAAQIAAAVIAALPYNFPYSAVATAGVIVFTALNKGTCGNYLAPVYNFLGLQNYAPEGVGVSIVSTTAGSVNPTPLNYATVLGQCCYSVFCLLFDDVTIQGALEAFIRLQWSCNIPAGYAGAQPQCFGHGYTYNVGSLGTILSEGDNAEVFNRWAQPLNDPNAPYLLVAAYAGLTAANANSPEEAIQGPVDGVLTAISRPTSCSEPWSYPSQLTLTNAGFVTWGPVTNAPAQLTNPYVYADITNNLTDALDRPNPTWQSTTTRRWAANFSNLFAQYCDNTFNGLSAYANGTKIKQGIFGTTMNMMRANIITWLNSQAGILISNLQDVNKQVILTSSLDTAPPCQGKPGNYALQLIVQPPVRINNIATTIMPELFTNCNNGQYTQAYQLANQ